MARLGPHLALAEVPGVRVPPLAELRAEEPGEGGLQGTESGSRQHVKLSVVPGRHSNLLAGRPMEEADGYTAHLKLSTSSYALRRALRRRRTAGARAGHGGELIAGQTMSRVCRPRNPPGYGEGGSGASRAMCVLRDGVRDQWC